MNTIIGYVKQKKILFLRILLLVVFSLSFLYKILSHEDFAEFLIQIFYFDSVVASLVSNILLGTELYFIIVLVLGDNIIQVLFQSLLLLIGFTFFLVYLVLTDFSSNCYCFGTFLPLSASASLVKNIVLITIIYGALRKEFNSICSLITKNDLIKLTVVISVMAFTFSTPTNLLQIKVDPIDARNFSKLSLNKNLIIVDARSKNEFTENHIPKAINIPYQNQHYSKINVKLIEKNRDKIIVIYCSSKICSLAKMLAIALKRRYSLEEIYYLEGGIEAWQKTQQH